MRILITGITSGFGRAMAQRLAADGHTVYGTYRHESDRIPGVTYIWSDVTDESSVSNAVRTVLEDGPLDVFISNAGMGIGGPLEFTPLSHAMEQMDVNFMGMVRYLDLTIPAMRAQGYGKILCFSSIGGLMGLPYQGMYSASKFAIEGYCEALRMELGQFGISVTVINPGDFSTAFTANRKKLLSQQVLDAYPSYATSIESIENDENSGLTPQYLADRIARIITRRHPRPRYIIATPVQRASVLLKRLLPSRLFTRILSSYYKL